MIELLDNIYIVSPVIFFILGIAASKLYPKLKDGCQSTDFITALQEANAEYRQMIIDAESVINNPAINDAETVKMILNKIQQLKVVK